MKKLILKSVWTALAVVLLASCAGIKPHPATVKVPKVENEINAKNELQTFLSAHPKMSVVVRVPVQTQSVTSAQQEDRNFIYKSLENELIKADFDVKDRASVENLLTNRTDLFDYEQVAKKIGVDLFVQVTDLVLDVPHYQQEYTFKATGQTFRSADPQAFNPAYAKLEFRLVIASTGSVAGTFVLVKQTNVDGADIYVLQRKGLSTKYRTSLQPTRDEPNPDVWYDRLAWGYKTYNSLDEIAAYFSKEIINILKKK